MPLPPSTPMRTGSPGFATCGFAMPAAGFLPPRTERAAARAIPAAAALAPSARRRGFAFTTLALVPDFAAGFATGFLALRAVFFAFDAIADRKSTRLNSIH